VVIPGVEQLRRARQPEERRGLRLAGTRWRGRVRRRLELVLRLGLSFRRRIETMFRCEVPQLAPPEPRRRKRVPHTFVFRPVCAGIHHPPIAEEITARVTERAAK